MWRLNKTNLLKLIEKIIEQVNVFNSTGKVKVTNCSHTITQAITYISKLNISQSMLRQDSYSERELL